MLHPPSHHSIDCKIQNWNVLTIPSLECKAVWIMCSAKAIYVQKQLHNFHNIILLNNSKKQFLNSSDLSISLVNKNLESQTKGWKFIFTCLIYIFQPLKLSLHHLKVPAINSISVIYIFSKRYYTWHNPLALRLVQIHNQII